MKWTIEYFEQEDTTQPAELFEDELAMNRYEQRRQKHLQNPEIAEGYREMAAELQLMRALDEVRKQEKMTKEALAAQMGKKREVISRLFTTDEINPTLGTFIEMLSALKLTADITLRRSKEGEGPIKVVTELIHNK